MAAKWSSRLPGRISLLFMARVDIQQRAAEQSVSLLYSSKMQDSIRVYRLAKQRPLFAEVLAIDPWRLITLSGLQVHTALHIARREVGYPVFGGHVF